MKKKLQYKDLITFSDLVRLTKDQLIDIATDMSLKEASSSIQLVDIASAIYEKATSDSVAGNILNTRKSILFAGRGSVSWYKIKSQNSKVDILREFIDYLKAKDRDKPFEQSKIGEKNLNKKLTGVKNSIPILLGALEDENQVLLRYAIRSGIKTEINAFTVEEVPKIEIVTVVVIPDKNLIEIRASSRSASKVHRSIVAFIKENINKNVKSKQYSFKEEFRDGNPVKDLAEGLDGQVIENIDIPSKTYVDMTDEAKESIAQILNTVSDRLNSTDGATDIDVNAVVDNARGSLEGQFSGLSFPELILNGLTKVDLSSIKELLNTPLYSSLSDHLTTTTTYIRFPVVNDGSTDDVTIRVGLTVNTVVFSSGSTEEAIELVRNALN